MTYLEDIQARADKPGQLEDLYQAALQSGDEVEFIANLEACYQASPDNLVYAAWHFRLTRTKEIQPIVKSGPNWKAAIPLGITTGLIFWALSDVNLVFLDHLPYLLLFWAPIAALLAIIFLVITSRKNYRRALIAGAGLVLISLYVLFVAPGQGQGYHLHYLNLAAIHLPLASWTALGITVLGSRSPRNGKFSFLMKSIEVAITAGVYLIAGVAFGGITIGMFQALSIELPEVFVRLIAAGGFGLLPVLAVASMYDPIQEPSAQDFTQGLSKFIATMMRLLLPLTLVVLLVYLFVIPFNFMEPFRNRDVLIVYNVMLFAIMGLLMGVTPVRPEDLSPRLKNALFNGILGVACLAVLISLYALSATVYRTVLGGITINRLTIIGWNTINIAILTTLVYRFLRWNRDQWVQALYTTFSNGMALYITWGAFILIAIPLLFR